MQRLLTVALAGVTVLACRDPVRPRFQTIAARVVVVEGDSQVGVVRTQLEPVAVRVLDDRDLPIAAQVVSWVVIRGGGAVFAPAGATDATGRAQQVWTLGDTAMVQILEARAVDSAGTPLVLARIAATAEPGPTDTLLLTRTDTTLFVGQNLRPIQLLVIARDAYGNAVNPAVTLTASAGWIVDGDSVWSAGERAGTVYMRADSAESRIAVMAVIDIRTVGWMLGWTCRNSPVVTRGTESPPIGLDTLRAQLVSDSANYAGDPGYRAEYSGRAQLWFSGPVVRTWKDGVVDTVILADELLRISGQAPDTVSYDAGDRCTPSGFQGPNSPVTLSRQP